MEIRFTLWRRAGKTGCRFIGNPLFAVPAVLGIIYVAGFLGCVGKYLRDSYLPYEGEVVAIKRSWTDWFLLESNDQEHLVIRTPAGNTVDRVVSLQTRSLQRIEVGDYVVKDKGIRNHAKPRGKRTTQEIREMALEQIETATPNRTPAGDRQKAPPEERR